MNTIIITGWGWKDYACAAALALRHHKNADVIGMSTRRLPDFLSELSGYKEIIILGVGLTGNIDLLSEALNRLIAKQAKIRWISAIEMPDYVNEEICSKIEIIVKGNGWITDAVSLYYNVPYQDLIPLLKEKDTPLASKHYLQLLEAAMYVYRSYQDEKSYANAIRHIANADPESKWSAAEKQITEHYKCYGNRELVGKSKIMHDLLRKIIQVAPHTKSRVLIYGESGTGKETVALQIHHKSPRCHEPFIAFNCASVNPALLESRFLGHEKGAFTGANGLKRGVFEQANGGTLFLDEIGELPLEAQGLLLRVLEGGRFTRIGEKEEIEVDVRLVTATNRDLALMVRDGKFREDLFHRLNVIQIRVAPLREHKEDIEKIANGYWLKQHRRRLEDSQIEALMTYDYPGNVRELFNLLERASVLDEMDFARLIKEHKEMTANLSKKTEYEYPDNLEAMTRLHVKKVYEKYNNNLSKTAEALNAARNTVRKYLE